MTCDIRNFCIVAATKMNIILSLHMLALCIYVHIHMYYFYSTDFTVQYLSYVVLVQSSLTVCYVSCRAGGKAAIGYFYGDSVAEDYNMSDNDSDVESIHEEEGLLCLVCICMGMCFMI